MHCARVAVVSDAAGNVGFRRAHNTSAKVASARSFLLAASSQRCMESEGNLDASMEAPSINNRHNCAVTRRHEQQHTPPEFPHVIEWLVTMPSVASI